MKQAGSITAVIESPWLVHGAPIPGLASMMGDGHDDEVFTVIAKNDSKRESLHPALAMNSVDHRKPFGLAGDRR